MFPRNTLMVFFAITEFPGTPMPSVGNRTKTIAVHLSLHRSSRQHTIMSRQEEMIAKCKAIFDAMDKSGDGVLVRVTALFGCYR